MWRSTSHVRSGVALGTALLATLLSPPLRADEPPPDQAAPATSSPKREVPDYSGRGADPATAGDAALWVPRIVLSPVYLVTEYVLRYPLSVAVPAAEEADLPRKLYDFFAFGPDHKAGIVPVGLVEFDFNPSVGLFAFWNDAMADGNNWRVHAEAWPNDWYAGSLAESMRIGEDGVLSMRVAALHRPDRVFYGLGPDSLQDNQSRYTDSRIETGMDLLWRFWRSSRFEAGVGLRDVNLSHGHFGGDPSVEQEAASGAFLLPYGFDRGYTEEYNRLTLAIDTRPRLPVAGSPWRKGNNGFRLQVDGEEGNDIRFSPASTWIRYGASATGFVDLTGHGRVLSLDVMAEFADPLGSTPIPFTELVSLGGDSPMRGYYSGRLVDRSAAAVSLRYVWPVAIWLDGKLEASVGNVFGTHLEDLKPGEFRFSGDLGFASRGLTDYPVDFVVGFGSETFDHGAQIDSVRVSLSVNHGF